MYKPKKNNKFCYSNISYYSWSADARATDELTSGIARCSCAPSLDSVLGQKFKKETYLVKASQIQELVWIIVKIRQEVVKNCFPVQTEVFY